VFNFSRAFWNLNSQRHKLLMKKLINNIGNENYKITNGLGRSNFNLNVSLEKLIKLLGHPSIVGSGDNKVQVEWVYHKEDGKVAFSIYDYKSNTPIHNIRNWHVGSKSMYSENLLVELKKLGFNVLDEIQKYNK